MFLLINLGFVMPLIVQPREFNFRSTAAGAEQLNNAVVTTKKNGEPSRFFEKLQCLMSNIGKLFSNLFSNRLQDKNIYILTCGKFVPPLSDSSKLRENFALGKEIINHVNETVLFSSNYFEKSSVTKAKDVDDLPAHKLAINDMITKIRDKIFFQKSGIEIVQNILVGETMLPQTFLLRASFAEKYNVGNCGEMACVGLKYAIDHSKNRRVEIFQIDNGDHWFLVIGRKNGTDPADYEHWGEDAIVCDPWSSSCYSASQIENFLIDFVGTMIILGKEETLVRHFDPSEQSLKLIASTEFYQSH